MLSRLSKKSILIAISIIVLLSAAAFAYYQAKILPAQTNEDQQVQTTVVRQGDLAIYASGSGTLIALNEIELGFDTSGPVEELYVQAGDQVHAGDLLAAQGDREQLEAAVASDQLSVMNAQHSLDDLFENADVVAAQAQLELAEAMDQLHTAEYTWSVQQQGNRASQAMIDAAEANLLPAEIELDKARAEYNKVDHKPDDNRQKAISLSKLAAAQMKYDSALRELNWYKGEPTELQQAQLDADVELAKALVAQAQRAWDQVKDGPDPNEVRMAELQLSNAEVKLAVSQRNLAEAVLMAPIDGTILSVSAQIGQDVTGTFITLADAQGVVLIAGPSHHVGDTIPGEVVETWHPIQSDGQVVGWVVAPREQFEQNPAERSFVNRTKRTLTMAAIGAAAFSLLLGVLLSRTLTHPLRELTAATRAIAQGDLNYKVRVRSRDEIGELANSFNLMSDELARAQALRRQMTAVIAHELRTPISVILGHVDALEEGVLPASSETFDILREETSRLERLVEDLRTLSRADAGELTIMPRPVQPQAMLEQAIAAHRPLAHERQVTMHLEAEARLPQVRVDPDRMAQVFNNLLNNALRYSPAGGQITLRARRANKEIELQVEDSGPCVPPEEIGRIFDRFYRMDPSRQRESGGSGLGLPIARSIVEMHGGRIWAESEAGKGTLIIIRIPVLAPANPT